MDEYIEAIQAALAEGAAKEVRLAGARACHAVYERLRRSGERLPAEMRDLSEMLELAMAMLRVSLLADVVGPHAR